jgi:4-amino-4-deoxy-L-arabinose transferase-like glycosyltransferase
MLRCHADWLLLLVLGLPIYAGRAGALTIRGEESRRVRITCEMIDRGNLFVQTEQGDVFAERPPLCNWIIALGMFLSGSDSVVPARLFSAAATIGMSLLLYAYARTLLTRVGALAAGASFLTMSDVMNLGGMAENEAIMTFTLGGALVVWEWGYRRHWASLRTWSLAYTLLALATLAKGLQAPVYFVGGLGLFLLLRRDLRFLFTRTHAAAACLFAVILALWQVPYLVYVGPELAFKTWTFLIVDKMQTAGFGKLAKHVAVFPIEVFGSLVPWSPWLLALADRRFRASLDAPRRSAMMFYGCAWAVAFPTVWFASGGRPRYLMPLFPLAAMLVAMAIDYAWQTARDSTLRVAWSKSLRIAGIAALVAGVAVTEFVVLSGSMTPPTIRLHLIVYAATALACGGFVWRARNSEEPRHACAALLGCAFFVAATFVVPYTAVVTCNAADAAGQTQTIAALIPSDVEMVSLGSVEHIFQYHFKRPIRKIAPREAAAFEYFCFNRGTAGANELNFPWQPVGEVCCDRNADTHQRYVVVARRMVLER